MAVSIPSVGTTSETATNVATPTTLTPGLPATRAVQDILLCLTVCRDDAPTVSCSTSGWVELLNVSANAARIALYAALVTGSEVAAQPVWASLATGTGGTGASAQIAGVRGLDFTQSPLTSLLHQLSAVQSQAASSVTQAMGETITPTKSNTAIFSLSLRQDNDVTDANWPVIATLNNVTWAKVAAVLNSASGADHAQSWQWGQQGAATAIAAKTVTVSGASSDASVAVLVSLLTAQLKTLVAATGSDAAQALSKTQAAQSKTLTAGTETDAAQPLDYELVAGDQHKNLVAATETDAAQALAITQEAQSKTLVQALETDAAQNLSTTQQAQTKELTAASENDVAQSLSSSQTAQTKDLGSTSETDAAQAVSFTQAPQTPTLTAAAETDAAQALSVTQAAQDITLSAASETDAAQALSHGADIHPSFAAASETDAAGALAFTQSGQSIAITTSTATDTAMALTYSQAPISTALTPASEIDTATALTIQAGAISLTPTTTLDQAMTLNYVGGSGYPAATGGSIVEDQEGHLTHARGGHLTHATEGVVS